MENNNSLAKQFNAGSLLRYALPSILMMAVFSMYSIVDGMFISRFVGQNALAGLNIIFPVTNLLVAVTIMIAHGGNATISKYMGEGKAERAKQVFSSLVLVALGFGVTLMAVGLPLVRQISYALGANEATIEYSVAYGGTMLIFVPFAVLQMLYQTFFVTAGKPQLGLILTLVSGGTNVLLDYIFIVPCNMGIGGAALATSLGQAIPAVFGTIYFFVRRNGALSYVRPRINRRELFGSLANGSSEMLSNLAVAITTVMFNLLMCKFLGEEGISAITIIQYTQFLLTSIFMGYSAGIAPIVGYKYGAKDTKQQQLIFKISMLFIGIFSVAIFLVAFFARGGLVSIFADPTKDPEVYNIAVAGLVLFAPSYLFAGYNIFASSYFTAFSNGFVSALLSFMRTLVFLVLCLIILPAIWQVDGVWLAVPVAEALALIMSIVYLVLYGKRYGYALVGAKLKGDAQVTDNAVEDVTPIEDTSVDDTRVDDDTSNEQ